MAKLSAWRPSPMPLTKNNIAEMRLRHLDQITHNIRALEADRSQGHLFTILIVIITVVGAIIAKSFLCLFVVVYPAYIMVMSDRHSSSRLQQLRALYHASLEEGFEALPDFAVLNSNSADAPRGEFENIAAITMGLAAIIFVLARILRN